MKIAETIYRECCQYQDLKALPGTKLRDGVPVDVRCKHCRTRWVYERYTDVAGSADWRYVKDETNPRKPR